MKAAATLERLVAWASDSAAADLVSARAEYAALFGEAFDDERHFDRRMAGFLEWFVCDRPAAWAQGRTPARARYEDALRSTPDEALALRPLTESVLGLFEVTGLGTSAVGLTELVFGVHFEVFEALRPVGGAIGDVVEARLVPEGSGWGWTPALSWHSADAAPLLRAEARRRRQRGDAREIARFTADAAQRLLKADRYRQITLERIYDFRESRL